MKIAKPLHIESELTSITKFEDNTKTIFDPRETAIKLKDLTIKENTKLDIFFSFKKSKISNFEIEVFGVIFFELYLFNIVEGREYDKKSI